MRVTWTAALILAVTIVALGAYRTRWRFAGGRMSPRWPPTSSRARHRQRGASQGCGLRRERVRQGRPSARRRPPGHLQPATFSSREIDETPLGAWAGGARAAKCRSPWARMRSSPSGSTLRHLLRPTSSSPGLAWPAPRRALTIFRGWTSAAGWSSTSGQRLPRFPVRWLRISSRPVSGASCCGGWVPSVWS